VLLKSGEVEPALDCAQRIEVSQDKAAVLIRVAEFCADSDETATLKLAIEQAVSLGPAIEERTVKANLRHRAARIYSEIGNTDAALALLENERLETIQLTDAAARGLAFCELAAAQSRAGASDLSGESLKYAKNEIPTITSAFLRPLVLGRIASTESLMGDPARFQSALAAAQKATDEIDDEYKGYIVLKDLWRQLFAVGRPARAKDRLDKALVAFGSWP
jgi:tetratricopeptide (TPR) repeat protein